MDLFSSIEHHASIRAYFAQFVVNPALITPSGSDWAFYLNYPRELLEQFADESMLYFTGIGQPLSGAGVGRGETVVDLGCGSGVDVCLAGYAVGSIGKVYGIDISGALLQVARRQIRKSRMRQVITINASMDQIPLPSAIADLVISNNAIHMSLSKEKVVGEIFRVLRPGGRVRLMEVLPPPERNKRVDTWSPEAFSRTISESQWRSLLHQCGLEGIHFQRQIRTGSRLELGIRDPVSRTAACIQAIRPD